MIDRRSFVRQTILATAGLGLMPTAMASVSDALKIGIIGLDTSHATAFTKIIHDETNPLMKGARVTSAYPYGSTRIATSADRIVQYSKEIAALGVKIESSLQDLVDHSDVIMLLTNDGTMHADQLKPVLKSKKRVYIDKPVGSNLKEVLEIYKAANDANIPIFSSSALRYLDGAQKVRYDNAAGKVIGAEAYSPQKTEPSHTDLFWYGIHGVEILFTMMGPGCEKVKRITSAEQDLVIGQWTDGRIGTYKGDLQTRQFYGGTAYGTERVLAVGPFENYKVLVEKTVQFFRDGIVPVDQKETIEIYTFMEAADVSKKQNGDWIMLNDVLKQSQK